MIKLSEKYNPEIFATFLREFLPEDFEEKEKDIADISRCKVIRKAREIGHSPSLDVTVLEMEHDKETDPRVTIATDAFKLLALYGIDKALVVFNNKESDNYRFSYLTIKLDLDEKGKIKQSYSNARRYSFFLGTGAKTKTPEQQLFKKGRVKDTDDLLSRFSLEVVNKQFYLEVAKYFDELVKTEQHHLELPFQSDPNVRKNFAMRLIGRLTFCWFLKQKKSASGQLIPEQLLSSEAVKENYYHSTLEPLFFEVLNTQIDARDVRNDLYDKVPYLNGGLFSPQTDDYYDLDRGTFASKYINTLKVSDTWFKEFFLLLETYNFTIDENTVFDQELSVDPEMLGRIFENLLAEINPETGSSDRKRTGSFYTPRQIVEYMVDQSLLEFLKTKTGIDEDKLEALISYDMDDDVGHPRTVEENRKVVEAIESLKVLDPACGSGAFPMGALQKIVWILQQVDPDCKLWLEQKLAGVPDLYRQKIVNYFDQNPPDYIRKLDVIKNSIFGVDIQPIAVEISRLRCFLTLVVESEIDDRKQNRGIEPLPNLDFKFVCANTLIGLPKSEDKGLFEDHSGIEELSCIMSEYFSCSNQRKQDVRLRFTNAQKEILNKSLRQFGGATGDLTVKLTLWDPFTNKSNPWFDPEWMFGMEEKFDVVIGNPPYLRVQGIEKNISEIYKKLFASATGSYDLYVLFVERGLSLISQKGVVNYIMPHKWTNSAFGKGLRSVVHNKIIRLISFKDYQVFNASTYTSLAWFSTESAEFKYLGLGKNLEDNEALSEYFSSVTDDNFTNVRNDSLSEAVWTLSGDQITDLLQKLNNHADRIENTFARVYQGMATGKDGVFFLLDCINKDDYLMEGYSSTLNRRVVVEKRLTKPLLKGDGVHRYEKLSSDKVALIPYEKVTVNGEEKHNLLTESLLESEYPKAYAYLKECEVSLRSRENGRFDIDGQWYQFSRKQGLNGIEQEKIVGPEISLGCNFSYDQTGSFYSTTKVYGYILKSGHKGLYKFYLGILNSKVLWFFIKNTGYTLRGGYFTFKTNYLNPFPLPEPEEITIKKLERLVEDILEQKQYNADTAQLEKQVDEIVFDMYGLNEAEKEIVRNS